MISNPVCNWMMVRTRERYSIPMVSVRFVLSAIPPPPPPPHISLRFVLNSSSRVRQPPNKRSAVCVLLTSLKIHTQKSTALLSHVCPAFEHVWALIWYRVQQQHLTITSSTITAEPNRAAAAQASAFSADQPSGQVWQNSIVSCVRRCATVIATVP